MRNDVLETTQCNHFWYNKAGTLLSSTTSTSIKRRTYRDEITYGERRGDGFRKPTFYNAYRVDVENFAYDYYAKSSPFGSVKYRLNGISSTEPVASGQTAYYGLTNASYPLPVPSSALVGNVDNRLLVAMKNGNFNVGVFLAELPKAVDLILTSSYTLMRAMKAIKNRDSKTLIALFGNRVKGQTNLSPQSLYLQYRYGWKPLVNDIHDLVEALALAWDNFPPLISAVASRTEDQGVPPRLGETWKGAKHTGRTTLGVETKVWFSVENPVLYGLSSLGLLNPATIAWELVPYSFVFDWYVPVGNFLDALTAPLGLTFHTGYRTYWCKQDFEGEYVPYGYYSHGVLPRLKVKGLGMKRSRLSSFPSPKLYFTSGVNSNKIVALLALIANLRS